MKNILLLSVFGILSTGLFAQDSSNTKAKITFDGFVDTYFALDLSGDLKASDLFFNHTRRQEFNVNLALARVHYTADKVRANFGLMTGTYAGTNLSHEPAFLQNLWEANVGVKLGKDLWVDAGVFPSHLGFESAISSDNLTLTRSLVAESSPYYLSGANLSWQATDKWSFLFNVSNGWQVIYDPNPQLGFGTQIQFKPNDKLTFNSSTYFNRARTFAGINTPVFHDFYMLIDGNKDHFVASLDVGVFQSKLTNYVGTWSGGALIYSHDFGAKFSVAARAEYFSDRGDWNRSLILSYQSDVLAGSLNFDVHITENAVWRIETKFVNRISKSFGIQDTEDFLLFTSLAANF